MIREYFDINKIVGIRHTYMREDSSFGYYPAQPEKRNFFGFVTQKALSEGFANNIFAERVSEDTLISTFKKIIIDKKVYYPSSVTIYLLDDCRVTKTFNTDESAARWINQLIGASQGKFEVVNIKI